MKCWAVGVCLFVAGGRLGEGQQAAAVAPAIQQYCSGCHNAKVKAGGLALDPSQADNAGQHPEIWEKVVRKLRARYMPPSGMPRPDEKTFDAMVASMTGQLDRAAAAKPNPGRSDTFRRLNRTEYRNSVRDLLALDIDVTALLPSDDASHGFDNVTVGNCRRRCWSGIWERRRRSAVWPWEGRGNRRAEIHSICRRI